MALAYQTVASAASATCNKPTGTASGDTLIAAVFSVGSATAAALSGWTQQATVNISSFYTLTLLTKIAGGSEPASYTFTGPPAIDATIIMRASGGDVSVVIDGTPTSSATGTVGSITTTSANSLLVMAAVSGGLTGTDISPDAAMTERAEQVGGAYGSLEVATETRASAGATGTRTATSAGSSVYVTAMLVIKEATASTPATVNAVVATESATAPIPTPKASSKVAGVVATLSAQFNIPTVGVFTTVTVNAVVATQSSAALAPTLKTVAVVAGAVATLSALMPVPTVTGQRPATVVAITATEQAAMLPPSVLVKMRVIGVVATESAQMFAPSIGIPVRVTAPAATMTAQTLAPVVTSKVSILAPVAGLALSASLPSIAIGFTSPELVTTMPNKAHTLTWTDGAWPDLSQALVDVTVSPGFDALVFDAYTRDGNTVVLELSAADASTLEPGRVAPYQITADLDDRRALVLEQGLWVNTTPGVVMDGDALRNPRAITQGTPTTLTWSDPAWPVLDQGLVTVVIGVGRNERRYEAVIDAGDVVTLNLTATGAQFDPGVYPYEVRADFDATRTRQLATGLLTVNAA